MVRKQIAIPRVALGLMWLERACAGPCEIRLDYDGSWELRICRWVSAAALLTLVLLPLLVAQGRKRQTARPQPAL